MTMKKTPALEKTVFVLDHTPYFGVCSEVYFDFDFLKTRGPGYIPLQPLSKSLWTCSVESCIEYCRIVWDLFPEGKLIRFVVSDSAASILNTWSPQQQNLGFIVNAMGVVGSPPRAGPPGMEFSVIHGLRAAIEAIAECTESQKELKAQGVEVKNKCRVICLTSTRDNASMKSLEDIFQGVLKQQNKLATTSNHLLAIDHCHLVVMNIYPVTMETQVTNRPRRDLSPCFTSEIHSVAANIVAHKLSQLIIGHYDLASTTVTGIPMKEEQNASTSANYDVEIYHTSAAHSLLNSAEFGHLRSVREGTDYETTTLKWSTPRNCSGTELQPCSAQYRITPVDLYSRPSSCLITFLLNGRSVMLEMPRLNNLFGNSKSGGKLSTHLMSAHGGEIFIHTLNTSRTVLEDPPSISEGGGGRVTDYRITDFGALMQQNRLVPLKRRRESEDSSTGPLAKLRARLIRQTMAWPLTISSTLVYNLRQYVDPIPQLMMKESLTDEEVLQCKQVIYNLVGLEAKHEPLPLPNMGHRTKGQKREEQWRSLWNELETVIKTGCASVGHSKVLQCLIECRRGGDDKVELDQALRELDNMAKTSESDNQRISVIRATTDSPMSPPHPGCATVAMLSGRPSTLRKGNVYPASKTLLELMTAAEPQVKRMEFSGRITSINGIARLYPNLKDDKGPRGEINIE